MIELRDFQTELVDKLEKVPNRLVGDDPGLGKTYEGIALDVRARATYPQLQTSTLVVAPLSVLDTWREHYEKLTDLTVRVVDPKKRELLLKKPADVYIVHWDVLRLMPELAHLPWLHVIADECHRAQDRNAKQTRALKKISTIYRTGMSGTAATNTPDNLWSILNWLYPKKYKSYWRWYQEFVDFVIIQPGGWHKIVGVKDAKRHKREGHKDDRDNCKTCELHRDIAPFFMRRLKKDVLKELPDKYYTKISVPMSPSQQRVYDEMRIQMLAWVGEHADIPVASPIIVAQLTRLQQFACAYATVDSKGKVQLSEPSSKIDVVLDLIEDRNEQVVVFTQFAQMAHLIEKRLLGRKRGGKPAPISCVRLTGDVDNKFRPGLVRRFQEGEAQVFVGTIGAGGIGITLTASSTVIFTDRTWSPALNTQAEDRLHRIGQPEAVEVIDLMAPKSVDLGRAQRLEQKQGWLRDLLGDS